VGAAFAWGTLTASSLVVGALVALRFRIGLVTVGLVMAFGAGVLISAVAFDLVAEAARTSSGHGATIAGIFAGCGVFFGGDYLIDRMGGSHRKKAVGTSDNSAALGIVLGTVLDGVPESAVIGLTIHASGSLGVAYAASVFISNVPEALSSTAGLREGGWARARILWMWIGICLVSGLASLFGYVLFAHATRDLVAFVLAFAGGAILTMLADTMMPEAYRYGGKLVGVVTTLGFATAFVMQTFD
jgi:zinc transporter, ZIP family